MKSENLSESQEGNKPLPEAPESVNPSADEAPSVTLEELENPINEIELVSDGAPIDGFTLDKPNLAAWILLQLAPAKPSGTNRLPIDHLFKLANMLPDIKAEVTYTMDYMYSQPEFAPALNFAKSIFETTEPDIEQLDLFSQKPVKQSTKSSAHNPVIYTIGRSDLSRKAQFLYDDGQDRIFILNHGKKEYEIEWKSEDKYNADGTLRRINAFAMEVELAGSNFFYENGKIECKFNQLYYVLAGKTAREKRINPSKYMINKIIEALDKLNTTTAKISIFEEDGSLGKGEGRPIIEGTWKYYKKKPIAFVFDRAGVITEAEKKLGKNAHSYINGDVYDISASGIGITELSIVVRKYLLMEISKFKNQQSIDDKENKITIEAVLRYEANPLLVELDKNGMPKMTKGKKPKVVLKKGKTKEEKDSIRKAIKNRKELVEKILMHFKNTSFIKAYYAPKGNNGWTIDTQKTDKALKQIAIKEKRREKYKVKPPTPKKGSRKKQENQ